MERIRDQLIKTLWRGADPFSGFPRHLYAKDKQGWGESDPYIVESLAEIRPGIVVEVGVWKGASSLVMAAKLRELGLDAAVISVDTWLGAADHWYRDEWFPELNFEFGYPAMNRKFMNNVVADGLTDYVVPLPLDSINASEVLKHFNIRPNMIHIDAGHEYNSVVADLNAWWPMLADGGLLVGDDYYTTGEWPGVRAAFDEFFGRLGLLPLEHHPGKCRVWKRPR